MGDVLTRRRASFVLAAGGLLAALPAPGLAIAPAQGGDLPTFLPIARANFKLR